MTMTLVTNYPDGRRIERRRDMQSDWGIPSTCVHCQKEKPCREGWCEVCYLVINASTEEWLSR